MLSYRHSFHAGNFADVLKHIVLVECLEHLSQKATPFEYIDTHSGAGLFNFASADSQKLEEHVNGIVKLTIDQFPELASYFAAINFYDQPEASPTFNKLTFYPGSPSFAKFFLRPQDRAWLYELHPQDFKSLCDNMQHSIQPNIQPNMQPGKKIKVTCADGLKGMLGLMPPTSRRGLVLIDPSYELKNEYDDVVETVIKAHKKFATGTYAIWYPVVDRFKIDRMEKKLVSSGIKNIQRFELGLSADSNERGMTSSGLFVVNPPWKLFAKMTQLLPKLATRLGESPGEMFFKCDIIAGE